MHNILNDVQLKVSIDVLHESSHTATRIGLDSPECL